MKTHWLAVGVVSLGLGGVAPLSIAQVADRQALETMEPTQRESVRFEDLPGPVKQAVGQQMGAQDEVTLAHQLTFPGDRTVYSVRIVGPEKRARNLWVSPQGELIRMINVTHEGIRDVDLRELPGQVQNTLRKEAANQSFARIIRITQGDTSWYVAELEDGQVIQVDSKGNILESPQLLSVRDNAEEPLEADIGLEQQVVPFAEAPAAVRQTINALRGRGEEVTQVVRITRGEEARYRVRLESPTRARMFRLDQRGTVLDQWSVTEPGREEVRLNALPEAVRNTLRNVAGEGQIRTITQVTRGGQTWYVAEIEQTGGRLRIVRIDSRGTVIR